MRAKRSMKVPPLPLTHALRLPSSRIPAALCHSQNGFKSFTYFNANRNDLPPFAPPSTRAQTGVLGMGCIFRNGSSTAVEASDTTERESPHDRLVDMITSLSSQDRDSWVYICIWAKLLFGGEQGIQEQDGGSTLHQDLENDAATS
ncbi:hypothetical protein ACN47E_001061 [Coniothyrium glycines]